MGWSVEIFLHALNVVRQYRLRFCRFPLTSANNAFNTGLCLIKSFSGVCTNEKCINVQAVAILTDKHLTVLFVVRDLGDNAFFALESMTSTLNLNTFVEV